jgi:hypothetical protein
MFVLLLKYSFFVSIYQVIFHHFCQQKIVGLITREQIEIPCSKTISFISVNNWY